MTLIALSAAYGAAGSRIGPALAERLGVPFVDRAIAIGVADELDVPVEDAVAHEQQSGGDSLLERLLSSFTGADNAVPAMLPPDTVNADDFHAAARRVLLEQAQTGHGVILGRGAVAALRDDPRVLRVRLTGPADRRAAQAVRLGAADPEAAERALRRVDRTHAEYLRRYYDVDIDDSRLYHLVIDATALPADVVIDLIARAAAALTTGQPSDSASGGASSSRV